MADPKPTHTYVGNPGVDFPFLGLPDLRPGDTAVLTFEQADEVGGDFEPTPAFAKAKAEHDAKAEADAEATDPTPDPAPADNPEES